MKLGFLEVEVILLGTLAKQRLLPQTNYQQGSLQSGTEALDILLELVLSIRNLLQMTLILMIPEGN